MRLAALAAAGAVVLALVPATARADADPASDVLLVQDVFLPFFGEKPSSSSADYLNEVVKAANESGYPIKVAVIGSRGDLGGVFTLYGQPRRYAPFLAQELAFQHKGRLLVCMPAGFGFAWPSHSSERERRLLERLPIQAGTSGLVESTANAVKRLAAADGHTIDVQPSSSSSSSTITRVLVGLAGVLLLAAIVAAPLLLRRRRRATA